MSSISSTIPIESLQRAKCTPKCTCSATMHQMWLMCSWCDLLDIPQCISPQPAGGGLCVLKVCTSKYGQPYMWSSWETAGVFLLCEWKINPCLSSKLYLDLPIRGGGQGSMVSMPQSEESLCSTGLQNRKHFLNYQLIRCGTNRNHLSISHLLANHWPFQIQT